jgi:hypothetical protein
MNITKITNGFIVDGITIERIFLEGANAEINSETMCHIPTQTGIICFDTSVTIEGESFNNIQDWIDNLYD